MSEMNVSVNDLPSGGITVRCEQDLGYLVDEYAERIQRRVDAAAIDRAAGTLAEFGYVKVVRCRDCKYGIDGGEYCAEDCADSWDWRCVEPDGFCAWGAMEGECE